MNELTLIKVEDLKKGDEIIVSCHSDLKYLKVLTQPKPKIYQPTGRTYYGSVKCSLRRDEMGNGNFKWKKRIFEQDVTKHNDILYQDLSGRDIFLVKRENN